MVDLFIKGGPVMWPIALFSVLALAVFIERLYALRASKIVPDRLYAKLFELTEKGMLNEAKIISEQDGSPLGYIVESALEGKSADEIESRMEEAGKEVAFALRKRLDLLGTAAAVSPLLGLLGTVTGMIKVFQDVTEYGVGNPADLAQGIWEALITTAAGLIVAIPAYLAYRFLVSKVDNIVLLLETRCQKLFLNIKQSMKETQEQ